MNGGDVDKLVRPGEILAGKYRIERILGRGGMGVVVAAYHLQLDERVAIKFLLPDAVARPDMVARFEREARAVVKIKSEHVARVIDVGTLETGAPYMVMEYLEGVDLGVRLERDGPMTIEETADFVLQACEAIVEAHALGIVHRDLKPANLFVVRSAEGLPSVKVLDFGISKADGIGSPGGMTQTSSMLGSPYYMSPEQMQSAKSVDARSDIWALGCILYQCVTGYLPFEAETLPELVLKIVTQPLPPLRSVRPDLPGNFEALVGRCLEKERDYRFQNIGELAMALVGFAPDRGRASADRIMRVVHAAGLSAPHPPSANFPPSSPQLHPGATQIVGPRSQDPSSTPAFAPQPWSDSRARAGAPPYASTTPRRMSGPPMHQTPMGPPPGTPPPGQWQGPTPQPRPPLAGTNASFGNTNGGDSSGNGKMLLGAAAALLLVGVGVVVALLARPYFSGRTVASAASSAPAVSVTPPVSVSVSVSAPPPPPKPVESVVAEEVVDAGLPPPPPTHPTTVTTPATTPAVAPKPNCNPPYYYDGKGNRVFKKECV